MPFVDVINNYDNGQTGTIMNNGAEVGYRIVSNARTQSSPNTDRGARITADGQERVTVIFDRPVIGVTLQLDRSNRGELYRIRIDGQDVNMQTLVDNGEAIFSTVIASTGAPGTHVLQNGGMTSTGVYDNGSLGFLTLTKPITSIEVFGAGGGAGGFDLAEIGIDSTFFQLVCFTAETELETPDGPRPIRDLAIGDRVVTFDGRICRILARNTRHLRPMTLLAETRLRPIRIAAGALGAGLPHRDLMVSRQHRIMVSSRIARRITGHDAVLIPAIRLVGLPGIEVSRAILPVEYHHIVLDRHDIVLANGAPAETLYPGKLASDVLQDMADDPCLAAGPAPQVVALPQQDMTPARPFVTPAQAKQIVAAHLRQRRPLLELLQEPVS